MRKVFRITVAIVLIVGVVIGPAIYRTFVAATSSAYLIVVAGYDDDKFNPNPWSESALLFRQDGAVWILETFDFPYRNRTLLGDTVPLVNIAASNRSMSGTPADQRYKKIVEILIERGESVEDRHHGYTAVQSSILLGDAEMVQLLVESGASLEARVERPGSTIDGMNGFELNAHLVAGKHPEWHTETAEYLNSLERDQP